MAHSAPRTRAAVALRMKQIALDNQSHMITCLRAKLATERRESAATKKEHETNLLALEASHMTIVGLTEIGLEEKVSLLQTIQGLQEENDAPAPLDDEWEEEPEEDPEEEELEDIPMGEGEIDDE
ncbi:adenosine deaminase-like protein [Dorcoceras hygrometricum]|uniref:Adenosine deaminase-like protein n=1 Tax=Dorcoceras hygrometricum TaxID=472368 RepID=A0A2Z7BIX3_9LAMI|nr:adenosine deaminase-like protein [Dorcoceras hygrometricum]